jgi:hypothetical protein
MFWSKRRVDVARKGAPRRTTTVVLAPVADDGDAVANELGLLWGGGTVVRIDDLAERLSA